MKELINETFEYLHSIPELGFQEIKTSEYLANKLESYGYTVTRNVGTTGIIGVLDSGKEGVNFALRADMDALPFEVNGKKVAKHACGHDANSTMVLMAAKIAAEKGIKEGKLTIVFQQGEEMLGSIPMIETGMLDNIDEMMGIHLRPDAEAKLGEVTPGVSHSAGYFVTQELKGKASHGARPHLGANVLETAIAIIGLVNSIKENPLISYSVKATQLNTIGNPTNTIPDNCRFTFDIRSENNDVIDSIVKKIKNISKMVCEAQGVEIVKQEIKGVPAAELDEELVSLCEKAIQNVCGSSLEAIKTSAGEDIHYFKKLKNIKIGYIGVGGGVKEGLHNYEMTFDQSCLETGVKVLTEVLALKYKW